MYFKEYKLGIIFLIINYILDKLHYTQRINGVFTNRWRSSKLFSLRNKGSVQYRIVIYLFLKILYIHLQNRLQ